MCCVGFLLERIAGRLTRTERLSFYGSCSFEVALSCNFTCAKLPVSHLTELVGALRLFEKSGTGNPFIRGDYKHYCLRCGMACGGI